MPKKTKREKIIAEYRRKRDELIRETVPANPLYSITSLPPRQTASSSYPTETTAAQPMDQAIRRDLLKTLILAALAIGGEVALSYIM